MITGSSTLIQVFQLYQNKIKENKNWRYNLHKYHNMSIANPITMQLIN